MNVAELDVKEDYFQFRYGITMDDLQDRIMKSKMKSSSNRQSQPHHPLSHVKMEIDTDASSSEFGLKRITSMSSNESYVFSPKGMIKKESSSTKKRE